MPLQVTSLELYMLPHKHMNIGACTSSVHHGLQPGSEAISYHVRRVDQRKTQVNCFIGI